ncbi:MAG: hypothetical protein NC240_04480 [Clostridium sp.]|nr:hypothetical protein [Clostridium sp.]
MNMKTGFRFVFYRPLGHQNVQEMTKSEKPVYEHLKECDYLTIAKKLASQKRQLISMLSAVLRSDVAIQVSIYIMETSIRLLYFTINKDIIITTS